MLSCFSDVFLLMIYGWKYDENQPKPLMPGSGEKNLEEAIKELD